MWRSGHVPLEEMLSAPIGAGLGRAASRHDIAGGNDTVPSTAEAATPRLRLTPKSSLIKDLRSATVCEFCFSSLTLRHKNVMIHQAWIPVSFLRVNTACSVTRAERPQPILPRSGGTELEARLLPIAQQGCGQQPTSQKVGSSPAASYTSRSTDARTQLNGCRKVLAHFEKVSSGGVYSSQNS